MSSIIEGYNYDIFISYRQKDNKGDRWVSEFVDSLKTELESTFKEEISVYFDINPHDGLLETHDVDESLKEKLKCLVFIPIISRTYCDPKSFAWEHEFKAFVEMASKDQFGLKVKLPNGNVASRILPVRIYDLDNSDIKLCESVLGGILRGIEFIYKSAGVNRPLRVNEDHPQDNIHKTYYKDQINKVANSINEIIQGLSSEPAKTVEDRVQPSESVKDVKAEEKKVERKKPTKAIKVKFLIPAAVVALLIIVGIIAYPKIFKRDTLERLRASGERISVAVMPFQNITKDSIWNNWEDGIKDELINYLTNFNEELEVRQTESINGLLESKELTNHASITPSVASKISQKLDAKVFIYGSIKQAGDKIRVNAQLIDTKTEEALKSFQIEGPSQVENILDITDSLKILVTNFLIISNLIKGNPNALLLLDQTSTRNYKAYEFYRLGREEGAKRNYLKAQEYYLNALEIDSNFVEALIHMSTAYIERNIYDSAKYWCKKYLRKRNLVSEQQKLLIDLNNAAVFKTPKEEIEAARQMIENDDQLPIIYYRLGMGYNKLFQYDKAIPEFKKALEIYKRWGIKPRWIYNYTLLGIAYHKTGQYKKEKRLYRKAEKDFPGDAILLNRQAILSLALRDTLAAKLYITKYKTILQENSVSGIDVITNLAFIYSEAGVLDEAEESYRKALSLEPEAPGRMNNLAYFLIDKGRNIEEGLRLEEEALQLLPDNYTFLHWKGWGLYKQGKYQEALYILQKSWDLRMENAVYGPAAWLHLKEAEKAVANQKNN